MESAAKKGVTGVREGSVLEVVRTCWVIYQKAADAYRVLANNAMSDEISQLWGGMAEGMSKHILYWEKISERVEKDPTVEALGNPHAILDQLRDVEAKIDKIRARDFSPQFQLALWEHVTAAGADLELKPYGARALMSLRLEKHWGVWTLDYRPDYTAAESGLDAFNPAHAPGDREPVHLLGNAQSSHRVQPSAVCPGTG